MCVYASLAVITYQCPAPLPTKAFPLQDLRAKARMSNAAHCLFSHKPACCTASLYLNRSVIKRIPPVGSTPGAGTHQGVSGSANEGSAHVHRVHLKCPLFRKTSAMA
jgi:hypothetical protein